MISGLLSDMTRIPTRETGSSKHQGVANNFVNRFRQDKMLHFTPG